VVVYGFCAWVLAATIMSSWMIFESFVASLWNLLRMQLPQQQPLLYDQDSMEEKAQRIEACLARKPVNLWELRELALSRGGLLERKCS
jgi:hypothetical protein